MGQELYQAEPTFRDIISRCDQLICLAFHDSETLLASCRNAEDMGKVVSLLYFD